MRHQPCLCPIAHIVIHQIPFVRLQTVSGLRLVFERNWEIQCRSFPFPKCLCSTCIPDQSSRSFIIWQWPVSFQKLLLLDRLQTVTLIPEASFYSFLANFAARTTFIFFHWHEALRAEKRKPLVKTVGVLTFMPSAFDRRFWLEDIFNCSTSRMIGWIKYLWGCNWSKENDIFDSCQVLS